MARGWRKYPEFHVQEFAQWVNMRLGELGWSPAKLSRRTGINRGTLAHLLATTSVSDRRRWRSLPKNDRRKLIDALAGGAMSRQDIFKLAGLTAVATLTCEPSRVMIEPPTINQMPVERQRGPEERASLLHQEGAWQAAATQWLRAAQLTEHREDWPWWARCLLCAGQMALYLSQFTVAEDRFKKVLSQPPERVGKEARADAAIRMGWIRYEQEDFAGAAAKLAEGLRQLTLERGSGRPDFLIVEHGFVVACRETAMAKTLAERALHFLGRTYTDWGIRDHNACYLERGLHDLQQAYDLNRQRDLALHMGFCRLREVPIPSHQGNLETATARLDESETLLSNSTTASGHVALERARIFRQTRPGRVSAELDRAQEGFLESVFYTKYLAEVLREQSDLLISRTDELKTYQRALHYALTATALHPYGQNLSVLEQRVGLAAYRMGKAFGTYWDELEEQLWAMDEEPFSLLHNLLEVFGDQGVEHLQGAIKKARAVRLS